jgi:hypothetical protein
VGEDGEEEEDAHAAAVIQQVGMAVDAKQQQYISLVTEVVGRDEDDFGWLLSIPRSRELS